MISQAGTIVAPCILWLSFLKLLFQFCPPKKKTFPHLRRRKQNPSRSTERRATAMKTQRWTRALKKRNGLIWTISWGTSSRRTTIWRRLMQVWHKILLDHFVTENEGNITFPFQDLTLWLRQSPAPGLTPGSWSEAWPTINKEAPGSEDSGR